MANWDSGAKSVLKSGDTLTCTDLKAGQIYAVFLYNSANQDQSIPVNINIGNAFPPAEVEVPGTTGNNGLAALALVWGTDTQTVSASISSQQSGAEVTTWIGSVGFPTDTNGISNKELPFNGNPQAYDKTYRYFAVPQTRWYQLTLNSPITQFISVQFKESFMDVFINNPVGDPATVIVPTGSIQEDPEKFYKIVEPDSGQAQTITYQDQGNGMQKVWMNADSGQNSENSTITAQYL